MRVLFVLLTVVPAIELYLLLLLGSWLGPGPTVAMLVAAGALGAWLVRSQGAGVLADLSATLQRGESPGEKLVEGALVILGGLLLVTPGVFTDLIGVAVLLPPVRRAVAPLVLRALAEQAARSGTTVRLGGLGGLGGMGQGGAAPPRPPRERPGPFDHPTF